MDKISYDTMLEQFNNVLDGLPEDTDDYTIGQVIELKSLFMDLYGKPSVKFTGEE